jgi:hypothetical protein
MDLSEVSEELSQDVWFTRIKSAMRVLTESTQNSDELRTWLTSWIPALRAAQSMGMAVMGLVFTLRQTMASSERQDLYPVLEELIAELREFVEALPDAGQWLGGIQHLDDIIVRLAEHPDSRALMAEFTQGLTRLVDDVVGKGIDILLNPKASSPYDEGLANIFLQIEDIVRRAVDRLL